VFIASSRPSLEANLAYCLRRLLVPDAMPSPEVEASLSALAEGGLEDPTLPPEPPLP
jgi:hypothetical protein